jgi:hypothetical protein
VSVDPQNHDEPDGPRWRRFAGAAVATAVLLTGGGAYVASAALAGSDAGDAASAVSRDGYGRTGGEGGSGDGPDEPSTGPAEPSTPDSPDGTGSGRTDAVDQHAESYSARGRELTLRFWGGVCSDYSADAEETEETVQVEIAAPRTKPGRVCVTIAKSMTLKVSLDQPVGDRTVVGASGREIPEK